MGFEYAPVTLGQVANFQEGITNDELRELPSVRPEPLDPLLLARAGIINQLEVAGEQQVMLKVTVAEVNRGAARSIGLNLGSPTARDSPFSSQSSAAPMAKPIPRISLPHWIWVR